MSLKEIIVKKSIDIGIDIIGFTDFEPFYDMNDFLHKRRTKGYETTFEVEDIKSRIDPNLHLSGGKTIIALGLSYNTDFQQKSSTKAMGKLSKSSWGIDYHKILEEKMKLLVEEIRKIQDFRYKSYVDTGPLIDRQIAKRSGIGWYGKNCSIINKKYGSFVFLGYILTDLEIEKDEPSEEECGECQLCIKACPVGAIENNYIINANRCIAFLTQTKERIPYDLRPKIGIKMYGCDTCQLVCPKNKGIVRGLTEDFIPKVTKGHIDLEEIVSMSNKDFKQKYAHMSGSWRGKNILRRNAIIAMGNIKNRSYIEILKKTIMDGSPMIREYSAWALLQIDKEVGYEIINKQIEKESSNDLKYEMEKLIKYYCGEGNENRCNI